MSTLPSAGGSSRLMTSGTQTRSLHKWKIVKNFSTRLTVLRRFGVKCRIETTWVEIQCSVSPELGVGSSKVAFAQLEKSNPSERTATKIQPGRCETRKARSVCKDFALDPVAFYQFLLTFIGIQTLKEDPPDGSIITKVVAVVAVTVRGVTQITVNNLLLFLCAFGLWMNVVHAQDEAESCKPEDSDAWQRLDYVEIAAWTILAIGGVRVAIMMYNRWSPLPVPVADFDVDAGLNITALTRLNEDFTIWPVCDDTA